MFTCLSVVSSAAAQRRLEGAVNSGSMFMPTLPPSKSIGATYNSQPAQHFLSASKQTK